MDIKHILEKLSEIDTKHTLLESAPTANVTPRPVVDITPSMSFRSVYEQLVSEVLSEKENNSLAERMPLPSPGESDADYQVRLKQAQDGKKAISQQLAAQAQAQSGAGIPNPPPNLNVAAPTPLTTGDGKPVGSGTPGVNWNEQPKPAAVAPQTVPDTNSSEFQPAPGGGPVATTSPVAPQTAPSAVTLEPAPSAPADPVAPAVTANPTTPAPAKTPYKGSAGSQEIQKLNPAIKDVNKIQVGQTLQMPDGSTYTVKPGDTLDKIAKGAKPAGDRVTTTPPTKQQDRFDVPKQIGKAPPAAPAPATNPAPAAPFKKELDQKDLDRIKQLSGAPAKPADKVDLSVNNPAMNPVNNAPGAAAPGGTTTTRTNQSVTGTMKMGKPDGPITFNGKVVNPGQPEYAAASQALIQSQQKVSNFKSRNDQNVEKNLAASGAPVSAGAPNVNRADFESVRNEDDAILERIRSALKF